MHLTPGELDRLLTQMAASAALARRERGRKLARDEAVAVISAACLDAARAGKTRDEVVWRAHGVLTADDLLDGVAEQIPSLRVEVACADGVRLLTVHSPVQPRCPRRSAPAAARASRPTIEVRSASPQAEDAAVPLAAVQATSNMRRGTSMAAPAWVRPLQLGWRHLVYALARLPGNGVPSDA